MGTRMGLGLAGMMGSFFASGYLRGGSGGSDEHTSPIESVGDFAPISQHPSQNESAHGRAERIAANQHWLPKQVTAGRWSRRIHSGRCFGPSDSRAIALNRGRIIW